MLVDKYIESFRRFLKQSWPEISDVMSRIDWDSQPYFLENWIQGNWELIVEKELLEPNQYLATYGYEQGDGSRITDTEVLPTHRIEVHLKSKPNEVYDFLCLVSKRANSTLFEPPFDMADLRSPVSGHIFTVAVSELSFELVEV